ncbi:MAG: O-acetyl-ADP-ribose deacetylase [Candidatus Cloacimonetes bacterium]|nr:O-acetyl-ADP-ribose deacetylase [Candidatus Cloacimonadota bacterium]
MIVSINKTKLVLIQDDITKQETTAIVNAANSSLLGGGGVDGAIHRAGGPKILKECKEIRKQQGSCPTGEAVITTGGNLKAKYVIHTVGPIWYGGNKNEDNLLHNCYLNSLKLAKERRIKSISFPSISTGAYHFPIERASKIALKTVIDFLQDNEPVPLEGKSLTGFEEVRFVLFSKEDYEIYLKNLQEIIDWTE